MYVHGNFKTYNYKNESGKLSLSGSKNTMNLKNCMAQIIIRGDDNLLSLINFYGLIQIAGNGNMVILVNCPQIRIGVQGNQNHVKIQQKEGEMLTKLKVFRNSGLGNAFPMTKDLDFRNPFFRVSGIIRNDNAERQLRNRRNQFVFGDPIYYHNYERINPVRQRMMSVRQIMRPIREEPSQEIIPVRQLGRQAIREVQRQPVGELSMGLSQEQLKLIPISNFQGGQDQKCIICIDKVNQGEQISFLPCFHCFHPECIFDWLKKSATCPLCLVNIKEHLKDD